MSNYGINRVDLAGMPKIPGLRRLREARAISQLDLAERSGVSRATISYLERGTAEARWVTMRKLAEALGVEPAELIRGD